MVRKLFSFLCKNISASNFRKFFCLIRIIGINETLNRIATKINKCTSYAEWYKKCGKVTTGELVVQRRKHFSLEPLISIVTCASNTPESVLKAMLNSILKQSYIKWQVCISGSSDDDFNTYNIIKKYADKDKRINYKKVDKNKSISYNGNETLKLVKGEYLAFLKSDDLLAPNALFEFVNEINITDADFIYSDEDKTDMSGTKFFDPAFKPDFSFEYFRRYNYISHLTIIKQKLLNKAGGYFDIQFEGVQDYDLFLRCIEKAQTIRHIPKILYHKRIGRENKLSELRSNHYTHEMGKKVLQAHLCRMNIDGKVMDGPLHLLNTYRIKYALKEKPLISIIIPNYNHKKDLQKCLQSIIGITTYECYEILVVENNSTDDVVFSYYETINNKENIKILYYDGKFNFSRINNWAVQQAQGKYIVFINNDIEMITPQWMQEMLMFAQYKNVGAVGAKLLYPDRTVQHGGVILHNTGVAQHAFLKVECDVLGYRFRNVLVQNLSAVTAALMMVPKNVFLNIGGFDEKFAVAYNDVDLCMRIRKAGYLIVYDPDVHAYHYESKSRGKDDTLEKRRRAEGEIALFYKKWKNNINDPYYNINLKELCLEPFNLDSQN